MVSGLSAVVLFCLSCPSELKSPPFSLAWGGGYFSSFPKFFFFLRMGNHLRGFFVVQHHAFFFSSRAFSSPPPFSLLRGRGKRAFSVDLQGFIPFSREISLPLHRGTFFPPSLRGLDWVPEVGALFHVFQRPPLPSSPRFLKGRRRSELVLFSVCCTLFSPPKREPGPSGAPGTVFFFFFSLSSANHCFPTSPASVAPLSRFGLGG